MRCCYINQLVKMISLKCIEWHWLNATYLTPVPTVALSVISQVCVPKVSLLVSPTRRLVPFTLTSVPPNSGAYPGKTAVMVGSCTEKSWLPTPLSLTAVTLMVSVRSPGVLGTVKSHSILDNVSVTSSY